MTTEDVQAIDWPDQTTPDERAAMIRQAHEQGVKNMEFHIASADILARESNNAVNLIGAAGLGALGYTASLLENNAATEIWVPTGCVSAYLLIIAMLLISRCLQAADIFPANNEAMKLYHPGFTAEQVLLAEIEGMQRDVEFNRFRNNRVGTELNHLRYAAFAAPLIFIIVWGVVSKLSA